MPMDPQSQLFTIQVADYTPGRWTNLSHRLRVGELVTLIATGEVVEATVHAPGGITLGVLHEVRRDVQASGMTVVKFALQDDAAGDWVVVAQAAIDTATAGLAH